MGRGGERLQGRAEGSTPGGGGGGDSENKGPATRCDEMGHFPAILSS